MITHNKIILALDTNDLNKALSIIKILDENIIFKLGMEFFYSFGYEGIKEIKSIKPKVKIFLDLKLHDIPNTVSKAITPLVKNIMTYMVTIHATGGTNMMKEAVNTINKLPKKMRPLILGVTVLTSLDSKSLGELGWMKDVNQNVINYSLLCKKAGRDGVVCSALEIEMVRKVCGNNFIIVTPGIRLENISNDDQARVVTPKDAFVKGADYIVIGRPIVNSLNPKEELSKVIQSSIK